MNVFKKEENKHMIDNRDELIKKKKNKIDIFQYFYEQLIAQKMKPSVGFEPVHLSVGCYSRHTLPLDHGRILIWYNIG